jgi:hypothetical protein
MRPCIRRPTLTSLFVLGLTAALAKGAPQGTEFVQAQQANSAALREDTWKSRTEVTVKGKSRNVTMKLPADSR